MAACGHPSLPHAPNNASSSRTNHTTSQHTPTPTKPTKPKLKAWIDELDADLPPLRNFILPSGGRAAALLHLARSVCRRAERSVAGLAEAGGPGALDAAVLPFLNRASDYLFQAARWAVR